MLVNIQMLKMQIRHWAELIIIARILVFTLLGFTILFFWGQTIVTHNIFEHIIDTN